MAVNNVFLREQEDTAVGNDKTITRSTERIGLEAEVLVVDVTTTSTAGARAIDVVVLTDGDEELFRIANLSVDIEDVTNVRYYVYPGSGDGEFPPFVFRPGYKIQVVDTADVDALDTIAVYVHWTGTGIIG